MKHLFALFFFCFASYIYVSAQPPIPYSSAQFGVRSQSNIKYGTVTNFAGKSENLSLDLYKPINDNNCKRPLIVFIHGGAFIGGDKADASIVALCKEMTKYGYVAASINYRLKGHVATNFTPVATCPTAIVSSCLQSLDTVEVYRGIYRGMQDVKGAIRFLKARAALDSTDTNAVFVSGESAGSILALAASYINKESERPAFCGALPDAGTPDADLTSCLPAGYSLTRPDLGSVEGTLNLNGQDATVKGCADFFGAVWSDVFDGPNDPALYLYHQTTDVIVDCGSKPGMYSLFTTCLKPLGCPKLNAAPVINGSCTIADMLKAKGTNAPMVYNDIISAGAANCNANPAGHSTVDVPLRCKNVTGFFAPVIKAVGNMPTNKCTTSDFTLSLKNIQLYPNPTDGQVAIFFGQSLAHASVQVINLQGQTLLRLDLDTASDKVMLDASALPQGVYVIEVIGDDARGVQRLVKY